MSTSITITELLNGDEITDLFINASSKENILQSIESQKPWSFKIKVNNGEIRNELTIESTKLNSFKHDSNKRNNYEWSKIIYDLFFEGKREEFKNIGINAVLKDTVVIEIVLNIGNGTMTYLGSIKLKEVKDDKDDEFNLFEWTKDALNDKIKFKLENKKLKNEIKSLKIQLEQCLKSQEELIIKIEQKESFQFKIFTKILNNFQEYNKKLINGDLIETEDQFNQDYIKAIINDVKDEEDIPKLKKHKTKKEFKNKDQSVPFQFRTLSIKEEQQQLIPKSNLLETEDESENDELEDSETQDESENDHTIDSENEYGNTNTEVEQDISTND